MRISLAVKDFISEKSLEVAPTTLNTYKFLFKDFLEWTTERELERVQELSSRVLKQYFVHLKEDRKNNEVSRNTKRKNLNTFFRWLIAEKVIEENPVESIAKAREEKKLKVYSDSQVQEILSYLKRRKRRAPREQAFHSTRDYYIFIFLISSGVRNGELVSLEWSQVDFKNSTVRIYGKAKTDKFIPVSSITMKELAFWKEYAQEELGYLPKNVFPNRRGQTLTTNSIKLSHQRWTKELGFRCSAHSARHYFAKSFLSQSNDLFTLSKLLGHSSLKITETYLQHFSVGNLAKSNEQFNPINTLNL